MTPRVIIAIDPGIYWRLPRPQEFIRRIASTARKPRTMLIQHPDEVVVGMWEAVDQGLEQARIDRRPVFKVTVGMDICHAIGTHIGELPLTAERLASLKLDSAIALVLLAMDDQSRKQVEDFVEQFIKGSVGREGSVIVVARAPFDEALREGIGADVQIIRFDGALTKNEMAAYVAMRMAGQHGPGTSHLLPELVAEFAGYDALMAEKLIALGEESLINLPHSLERLIDYGHARWSIASWEAGSIAVIGKEKIAHTLREAFVAGHPGSNAEAMKARLSMKYWRACAVALLPWMEELRQVVLQVLGDALDRQADTVSGLNRISISKGKYIDVAKQDLEISHIANMHRHDGFLPKFAASGLEQDAVQACISTKRVRDELAHWRAPSADAVSAMIAHGDTLMARAKSEKGRI